MDKGGTAVLPLRRSSYNKYVTMSSASAEELSESRSGGHRAINWMLN
jgi:hypothetical protein